MALASLGVPVGCGRCHNPYEDAEAYMWEACGSPPSEAAAGKNYSNLLLGSAQTLDKQALL
jgi:hypothetical protein